MWLIFHCCLQKPIDISWEVCSSTRMRKQSGGDSESRCQATSHDASAWVQGREIKKIKKRKKKVFWDNSPALLAVTEPQWHTVRFPAAPQQLYPEQGHLVCWEKPQCHICPGALGPRTSSHRPLMLILRLVQPFSFPVWRFLICSLFFCHRSIYIKKFFKKTPNL